MNNYRDKSMAMLYKNFLFKISIGAIFTFLPLYILLIAVDVSAGDDSKIVIGKFDGKEIYLSEANDIIALMNQNTQETITYDKLSDEQKKSLIKEIAAQDYIKEQVKKTDLKDDKGVKEKLSKIENEFLRNEFLARKAKELVSDNLVKQKYDEFIKQAENKFEYKASHILVKTKEEAAKIRKEVEKDPKKFGTIAKSSSVDKASGAKGGELGYFLSDQMVKPFAAEVEKMKIGDVSEPIETSFGWHIIKLEDKRKPQIANFEQAKDRIKLELEKEAIRNYLNKEIDDGKIEVVK